MPVGKVLEITSQSDKSFDDAIQEGIRRACKHIDDVQSAWIKEQKVEVADGKVKAYRVDMKVTFLVHD
jgi:hypothetical protein